MTYKNNIETLNFLNVYKTKFCTKRHIINNYFETIEI